VLVQSLNYLPEEVALGRQVRMRCGAEAQGWWGTPPLLDLRREAPNVLSRWCYCNTCPALSSEPTSMWAVACPAAFAALQPKKRRALYAW